MAIAGITGLVDFYILQKADLTNKLSDIMMEMNYATKECGDLAEERSYEKAEAKAEYYNDDGDNKEYYDIIDDITGEYELKLADISEWENGLEVQKQEYETEIQQVTSYMDTYKSAAKTNIQNDFSYGKGTSQ